MRISDWSSDVCSSDLATGRTEPGDHAKAPPARQSLDMAIAVLEQGGIAPELVDQEALDHRRVGRVDHRLRPGDGRDHAAPVDVAHQYHRHAGGPRKADRQSTRLNSSH